MGKYFVFFTMLSILCMPGMAMAIEDQNDTIKMKEVVVTAGRIEEQKGDLTTNITVLTDEEIDRASVIDLVDLLEEQGFTIREYPNSLASVNIRGFRTNTQGNDLDGHVILLIDGRRSGTGNITEIPLDNVARVEIIRGPGATQYGASALGGVINVITKQGEGDFSVYAETIMGNWDHRKNEIGASGKVNNFDFSLSGSIESQEDYQTGARYIYSNTGFDSKDRLSINAGFSFLENNRIGITFTGYEGSKIGSPNYISANDLDDYTDNSIKTYDLTYTGKTSDDKMEWSMRYFRTDREYYTFDGAVRTYYQDTDQQGIQAQLSTDLDILRLTGGIDWVDYEIEDTYSTGDNIYDNPAFFLLAKSKILDDKLIISAGLRFDKYDIEADDGRSVSDENLTPSIGAAYKINTDLSIRVNYAEAFKMPTADQLFMFNDYSAFGFGVWSGNENLSPEKSKTYEIGIDYSKGTLSAGATYYTTDYEDKIGYAYDAVADITQYKNIKGAKLSGIEGTFSVDLGDIFDLNWELKPYGSFSYFLKYEDEENNVDLQYNPEWSASYGVRASNPDLGFITSLNFGYFSSQDITDYEGTGETGLSSYTIADLSVSKELYSFNRSGKLSFKGDISNLFNAEYEAIQGYNAPGRTFNFGLRYEY